MKTKASKATFRALLTMIAEKNRPKKFWPDRGTEFAGEFEKLRKTEGLQVYSTMTETKVAFAEGTIRSVKNILFSVTWKTMDIRTSTN